MFLGPVHRERAAIRQLQHDRFAGCGHGFQQVLLRLGEIDAGPGVSLEPL